MTPRGSPSPRGTHQPVAHDGEFRIEVLGEVRILGGGAPLPFPAGKVGQLFEVLLLHPNRTVPSGKLIRVLWPGVDSRTNTSKLRVTATRLRRHLSGDVCLESAPGGYRLTVPTGSLDRLEFEALARDALEGDPVTATRALSLWRGEPYRGFASSPELERQRRQLQALHDRLRTVVSSENADATVAPSGSHLPPITTALTRRRLLDRLPRAGDARLIALSAPTGYGKTVLLGQWAHLQSRVAWRQLSEADNDPERFWATVGGALRDAVDGASPSARHLWHASDVGAVARLVDELVDSDAPVGVVLDDLHLVTNSKIHSQLLRFLRRSPGWLTVAVASRRSLPFSTGRLAADRQIVAVTAGDLAFTPEEATEALRRIDDRWCDGGRAHQVHQATAGWPQATLEVATRVPPTEPDPWQAPAVRGLSDEMLDAVLGDLDQDVAELMVETAHLDHLNSGVCTAVTGRTVTEAVLTALADDHHLLLRVAGGYRHHPLLAQMLRRRLDERGGDQTAVGHRRAGRWHLDHGHPRSAFDHAASAGDQALTAEALVPAVQHAVARADADSLRHWVSTVPIPPSVTEGALDPALLVAVTMLAPEERRPWLPAVVGEDVAATLHSVDLLRQGRCTDSLAASERAQELFASAGGSRDAATVEAARRILLVAETDCRILLGSGPDPGGIDPLPGGDGSRAPWIGLWAIGQRALHAFVTGDRDMARALLERAESQCHRLHPSWQNLADGSVCLTKALMAAEDAAIDARQGAVETIEEIARRCDRSGWVPMGIIALYGLSLSHLRAGDERTAQARLAEADRRRAEHPELVFLTTVSDHVRQGAERSRLRTGIERLTPAELTVLEHLDTHLSAAEIAAELYLSVHTVRTHIKSIYRKLGVHQRTEAVAAARNR